MIDTKYQKINTLFKRDDKNIIIVDELTDPTFRYLFDTKWEATEKIDGTNIRVIVSPPDSEGGLVDVKFMGRTDNAQTPPKLLEKLSELFPAEKLNEVFNKEDRPLTEMVVLYGEGYGSKIQKGGGRYIPNGVDFILFDIKVGNLWLLRDSLEDIAKSLGIKIVPLVGYMTISDAIDYVKNGFKSSVSSDKDLLAEGLVLKTPMCLLDRFGKRIITKIKTVDFRKLELSKK